MKIIYCEGNVFQTEALAVMHGCNCDGLMGSGIAAQVRKLFPKAYQSYMKIHNSIDGLIMGTIDVVEINEDRTIINAMTQLHGGREDEDRLLNNIAECCSKVDALKNIGRKVAMPQIGAGIAGGDWNKISNVIEASFKRLTPVVYIYKP